MLSCVSMGTQTPHDVSVDDSVTLTTGYDNDNDDSWAKSRSDKTNNEKANIICYSIPISPSSSRFLRYALSLGLLARARVCTPVLLGDAIAKFVTAVERRRRFNDEYLVHAGAGGV